MELSQRKRCGKIYDFFFFLQTSRPTSKTVTLKLIQVKSNKKKTTHTQSSNSNIYIYIHLSIFLTLTRTPEIFLVCVVRVSRDSCSSLVRLIVNTLIAHCCLLALGTAGCKDIAGRQECPPVPQTFFYVILSSFCFFQHQCFNPNLLSADCLRMKRNNG